MENKNEGVWQVVAANKKKPSAQSSSKPDTESPINSDNPSKSDSDKSCNKHIVWGDVNDEPELDEVMKTIADNLEKCEGFQYRMTFLKDAMALIAKNAADIIINEKKLIDNKSLRDRDIVQSLHDLAQFGTSFSQSMTDKLSVINDAIDGIEKQKKDILDGWNKFVRDLSLVNSENKHDIEQIPPKQILQRQSNAPLSFINALEGGKHMATHSNGLNAITTSVGIADIKCPVISNAKDVPLMAINYSTSMSTFLINLDGSIYSFGLGKFISRRGKNESTLYGKRCNPKSMACKGASCTYYHDPLSFATNAHTERNMAIPYITDDLIKGIATDQDILSNTTYSNNPFIVEDIVQLAGMLLLKAVAVKNVIGNNSNLLNRNNKNKK